MVGGFFPTPYPDECLYSVLCRYYVRSGSASYKRTTRELFGNMQCLSTSVFFPIRLDRFDYWIPKSAGITRESITIDHTMYPYMAMTCSADFRREMKRVISGKVSKYDIDFKGTQKSFDLWPKQLRYCPDCSHEDIISFGEAYWHRSHQLPGMVYCTKHLIRLIDSRIPMRKTTTCFYPASDEISTESMNMGCWDDYIRHKDMFLIIGRESEWLLNHGMNVDWGFNFQTKYRRLLRELDVVTIQGIADYDLIVARFNDFWGESFLNALYSAASITRDWIRQLHAASMMTFQPIFHILLMCFLKGSVKSFLESEPSENPFGEGPWPCANPICGHFNADGCINTEIRYQNGVATGFFRCDGCGMLYKQVKRKGRTGDIIIVDYGHFWKDELLRCLGKKKMTVPETAEVLKCEPHTVSWQKKAMGLSGKSEYVKAPTRYTAETGAEKYYKAKVLEVCSKYDEVTIALLNDHAPGAYSFFAKNDFTWLREHIVYERDMAGQRQYDQDLLKKLQCAVESIKIAGDEKRRLTVGYIVTTAGFDVSFLRYLAEKHPLTKSFLEEVVESKESWLRRRITMIWRNQIAVGKSVSLADVKREMSLKPNTYVKHGGFIKKLIDELNEQTDTFQINTKCPL